MSAATPVSPSPKIARDGTRRGGRRPGAGRKPAAERRGFVKHLPRPHHAKAYPVHVTMRALGSCPYLRTQRVYRRIRDCFVRAAKRGLRVLHYSVQGNHLHLILEAADRKRLWRAAQGLASGIARAVNNVVGRRGPLWRDRYHRRDLFTARQVRTALVYVLQNHRKHLRANAPSHFRLDPMSSAAWFDGWAARAAPALEDVWSFRIVDEVAPDIPVAAPRTDLARRAWRELGLLGADEGPSLASFGIGARQRH